MITGEKIPLSPDVAIFRCHALPAPWTSHPDEPLHFVVLEDDTIYLPVCDARFICGAKASSRYQRGSVELHPRFDKTVTDWLERQSKDLYRRFLQTPMEFVLLSRGLTQKRYTDTHYYELPAGLATVYYDFNRDAISRDAALALARTLEAAVKEALEPAAPPPTAPDARHQAKFEEIQRLLDAQLEAFHQQVTQRIDSKLELAMRVLDEKIDQLVERKRILLEQRMIQPPSSILAPPSQLRGSEDKFTIKC